MDKTSLHQALEKLSENSRTLTVFKIIQRQIIIYIFYFTEVQVSRVIIVLLLRNCFVWYNCLMSVVLAPHETVP